MNPEEILSLAKKLRALAEQGEGGEKDNAVDMLTKYCAKHNISLSDLESDIKKQREFSIPDEIFAKKLFRQIAGHVVENVDILVYKRKSDDKIKGKKSFFVNLTDAEFIEIDTKFNFYLAKFNEDVILFYRAFIHKNKLYVKSSDDSNDEKELTPQELEEINKIRNMMMGMESHKFLKQLENKS